jgi:hypothetical protein
VLGSGPLPLNYADDRPKTDLQPQLTTTRPRPKADVLDAGGEVEERLHDECLEPRTGFEPVTIWLQISYSCHFEIETPVSIEGSQVDNCQLAIEEIRCS